jgi:UDP-N-acetylglucosamine--N-acetylmuramyl-(pentapeptide) pyrophosphoryl-undecaprenol N-acetylglucosamine transferase
MSQKRVLIMAGGTGGHVFPALAVAQEFIKRGAKVDWLGTAKGIETKLVPQSDIPLHFLSVEGVRGKGLMGLLKAPFLISRALLQARALIKKINPELVVGFGGFASGPGGLVARWLNIPLVIHEQNAVAGTTNRLLASRATKVLSAFANAFKKNIANGIVVVGNPVRESIQQLDVVETRFAHREKESPHLLILGGSLGAKAINELAPRALAIIDPLDRPLVWHQTGQQHQDVTRDLYKQLNVEATADAFIQDMAAAYAWADLVICRAGALTVSELMVAGVGAILIPLPTAIDDHQTANAQHLVKADAGVSLKQAELTAELLATILSEHLRNKQVLLQMAKNAQQNAIPDSAVRVVNICEELISD